MDELAQTLAELAAQYWKLCQAYEHELAQNTSASAEAGAAQLRFARSRLDTLLGRSDMELRTYDGAVWSASLPPLAINAEDFGAGTPVIARTIEPTVLRQGSPLLPGKVLLGEG